MNTIFDQIADLCAQSCYSMLGSAVELKPFPQPTRISAFPCVQLSYLTFLNNIFKTKQFSN